MRLGGGYTALCHYLGMPEELGRLWVDAPGPGEVESANPVNDGGAASALARLLGSTAAAQVDKSALDYLLERRGYKPRRRSANYERPHDDDDAPGASNALVVVGLFDCDLMTGGSPIGQKSAHREKSHSTPVNRRSGGAFSRNG